MSPASGMDGSCSVGECGVEHARMPHKTGAIDRPQARTGDRHPDPWRRDLNPEEAPGQNVGVAGRHGERIGPTAFDVKDVHRTYRDFSDEELKQIRVLPPAARLEQGATYFDLKAPGRTPFTARGDMVAGPDNWYVAKSETDHELWNRLVGVTEAERL